MVPDLNGRKQSSEVIIVDYFVEVSRLTHTRVTAVPCRDFAAGYCSYGNFCSFVQ